MNKKTRSKWGSYEDWMAFVPQVVHEAVMNEELYKVSLHGLNIFHSAFIVEEARRAAVEDYCNKYDIALPWLPDYDLSTEEGCREAIRANGYDEAGAGVMGMRIWLYVKGKEVKQIDEPIAPSLGLWQKAAQYAIDNPVGDK